MRGHRGTGPATPQPTLATRRGGSNADPRRRNRAIPGLGPRCRIRGARIGLQTRAPIEGGRPAASHRAYEDAEDGAPSASVLPGRPISTLSAVSRPLVWTLYACLVLIWSSTWVAIKIGLED